MRIRETRTVGGGMGGPSVEDRVRIVGKDDLVPDTAQAMADDAPTHDWQPVTTAEVAGMVPASTLSQSPAPPPATQPPLAAPAPLAAMTEEGPK